MNRRPRTRRRGLTRNPQALIYAVAWTVALGLCAASALSLPVAPAVHV